MEDRWRFRRKKDALMSKIYRFSFNCTNGHSWGYDLKRRTGWETLPDHEQVCPKCLELICAYSVVGPVSGA